MLHINDHPKLTRAKTCHSKSKTFLTHVEPQSVKQTLSQPEWHQAMQLEYDAFLANQTWTSNTLPPHRKPIGFKWIFKVKENPNGKVNKYKAILVVKGYHQQFGFDFNETFSRVVKPITIRVSVSLVLTNK